MNENIIETNTETLELKLSGGDYSVLYKRVNSVTINDIRIRDAFARFIKEVECDKTVSAAEILFSADALLNNISLDENAGNLIFCFDSAPVTSKLMKCSLGGIYSLFAIHNGISVDIEAIGGSIESANLKRFLIVSPKKVKKITKEADKYGIKLISAGQILATNQIIITKNGEIIDTVDKSIIDNSSPATAITLGTEHFQAFYNGYTAVCSFALCNCVTANNIIRYALCDCIENVFARALGSFAAALQLKCRNLRIMMTSESNATVTVPRPSVADGDYFYLLKLRNDERYMPDRAHLAQLYYYLCEKKRSGVIKNVLPVKENIDGLLERLSSESIEYVPLAVVPDNCFGIIVSVPRGESVNGIKLGYFKNIL